jgi:phosphoglycerate dehydrogenase-like enzyme
MTPHISADAPPEEYGERVIAVFTKNLARLLAGTPLHNRVDRTRSY